MDPILAYKLQNEEEFEKKLSKLVQDYTKLGRDALDFWVGDFDVAHDMLMCYAPLSKTDYDNLSKGHPKRFVLPVSATQITTMATFIAQVLFGQDSPNKVEPRAPKDEVPAEYMNQLLRWNSEQQPTYLLGYQWVMDALVANRGIFYNHWEPVYGTQIVQEQVLNPYTQTSYFRPVRKQKLVGGFCKMDLISPYDFVCDPALPLWRWQEGRFSGHRTVIPWVELERRSKLPEDHPMHVLPSAVQKLKEKKQDRGIAVTTVPSTGNVPTGSGDGTSYTGYQRTKSSGPTGQTTADKSDVGSVECLEVWVKLIPADYEIYGPDSAQEQSTFQILLANNETILAINESTYAHGQFPYSVGEGRPSAIHQFSPSWMMMLKGLQDHIDWLKNRHQEALSRTVGNVFIYNPAMVDVEDFLNPEKEGLMIALKPEAAAAKISDCIQQVPIKDLTEHFQEEMVEFARMSESITGANSYMQGQTQGDASATEFAGTQQMAGGRMSSVARLLSAQALVSQTRQFASNFQQFLDLEQAVRFRPSETTPEALLGIASLVLKKDLIAGEFDFAPHDGTLPGTDAKKVAAIGRILEASQAFPQVFMPAPGNLDPRKLIYAGAKAAGVSVENFKYTPNDIPQSGGGPPTGGGPPGPPGVAPIGVKPPSAPPGPTPSEIGPPTLPPVSMPTALPPQARPGQM